MRRALLRHRNLVIDVAIAVAALWFTLGILLIPEDVEDTHDPDALAVVLAALSTLPLVAWRRAVFPVLVVTTVGNSLLYGLGYPDGPPVGPIVALFLVGLSGARVRGSLRLTIGLVTATLAIHLTAEALDNNRFPGPELLLGAPLWFAAWAAGDRVRLRRERAAELETQAQRESRLAVAEERTRIARDLHDSAGHAISVILVHAGAARLLRERDPERATRALETIEEVARETLGEIDQLVHALRDSDGVLVEPPAGLAALDALVQRHRDAGLEVTLLVTGEQRPLGAAIDGAAYRILQESLTNALRHGEGQAHVALEYGDEALAIAVTNAAARDGARATGHGIVGMRERTSLVGGSLDAAGANGVFRVSARLPYVTEEAE
jgi:signal transduction histidine kinase